MSKIGDDQGCGMLILPCSQQNKAGGKERGGGIYSCSRQWNVFGKPNEQRPSLLGLCHGEKTKAKPTDMVISDSACMLILLVA